VRQGLITTSVGALPRGGYLENLPASVGETAFTLARGEAKVIDEEGRVLVLVVDAVQEAAGDDPALIASRTALASSLGQALSRDMVDLYGRAALAEAGMTIDSAAIAAVHAQMR